MKNGVLAVLGILMILVGSTAYAGGGHSVSGIKIDTPNIIKISDEWSIGSEVGKDVISDIFRDSSDYFEADKGYFGYIKVTYTGSLLNLSE